MIIISLNNCIIEINKSYSYPIQGMCDHALICRYNRLKLTSLYIAIQTLADKVNGLQKDMHS